MGDFYEAACSHCGYRAGGLQDGAGLIGTFLEPMVCDDCRKLVSVVTADLYSEVGPELNSCPDCGGRRLSALPKLTLGEQAATGGFRLGPMAPCPRCRGPLTITPRGHWD